MNKTAIEEIIEALGVTAEAMGQQLSPGGLLLMADDLLPYGVGPVLEALKRVRRERYKLTLADVIDNIVTADGRPRGDEAWSLAICAENESDTVVWTEEMAQAFEVARPLLVMGDKVGARMAFKDTYERLVDDARKQGTPPRWSASLGWDVEQRAMVLAAAVEAGKIGHDHARGLLPPPEAPGIGSAVLALAAYNGRLTDKGASAADKEQARHKLAELRAMLTGKKESVA